MTSSSGSGLREIRGGLNVVAMIAWIGIGLYWLQSPEERQGIMIAGVLAILAGYAIAARRTLRCPHCSQSLYPRLRLPDRCSRCKKSIA